MSKSTGFFFLGLFLVVVVLFLWFFFFPPAWFGTAINSSKSRWCDLPFTKCEETIDVLGGGFIILESRNEEDEKIETNYKLLENNRLVQEGKTKLGVKEVFLFAKPNANYSLLAWDDDDELPDYYYDEKDCFLNTTCTITLRLEGNPDFFCELLSEEIIEISISKIVGLVQNPLVCARYSYSVFDLVVEDFVVVDVPSRLKSRFDKCFSINKDIIDDETFIGTFDYHPSNGDYLEFILVDSCWDGSKLGYGGCGAFEALCFVENF